MDTETTGEKLGTDAVKWAAHFRAIALKLGLPEMDEAWLTTWFANAIMAGHDFAERQSPALALAQEALRDAVTLFEGDDECNTPGTDSHAWLIRARALTAAPVDHARAEGWVARYRNHPSDEPRCTTAIFKSEEDARKCLPDAISVHRITWATRLTGKPEADDKETTNG